MLGLQVNVTHPSLRVLMLILLWLEYYYLFLRLFDLPLALRDRGLVNVVQYWCGSVAVHLRMVRDIHWLNVSTSLSPSNGGECPQTPSRTCATSRLAISGSGRLALRDRAPMGRRICFKLLSQVRVDAAQFVIYVVVSRVSKSMSYAMEGVKPDVQELGVSGICNRKRRLVLALLGFFREELYIICGLQRKEISSGGKYSLLTRASESGGWTVDDRDREDTASNWLTSQRKATIC